MKVQESFPTRQEKKKSLGRKGESRLRLGIFLLLGALLGPENLFFCWQGAACCCSWGRSRPGGWLLISQIKDCAKACPCSPRDVLACFRTSGKALEKLKTLLHVTLVASYGSHSRLPRKGKLNEHCIRTKNALRFPLAAPVRPWYLSRCRETFQ